MFDISITNFIFYLISSALSLLKQSFSVLEFFMITKLNIFVYT